MKNKTKRFFKRKREALITLSILFAIFAVIAGGISINEHLDHKNLVASMNVVYSKLKKTGIKAKKRSYCRRDNEVFGKGPKYCLLSISSVDNNVSPKRARTVLGAYVGAINGADSFKEFSQYNQHQVGEDPKVLVTARDFTGPRVIVNIKSDKKCYGNYNYNIGDRHLYVEFYCDDTSWFTKTFD